MLWPKRARLWPSGRATCCTLASSFSAKPASKKRSIGMSSPSSHTTGSAHALDALVAVVVPGPGRRDDEVARVHGGALAAHRGVGALAVDDEAQRRLHVAVRRRDLARHDELQPGIERLRDRRAARDRRVLQHQHAAHGLLGGDELGRFHQQRADLVVAPERGHAGRLRLARHQRMQRFPQRREMQRADALVVVAAFGGVGARGLGGGVHRGCLRR